MSVVGSLLSAYKNVREYSDTLKTLVKRVATVFSNPLMYAKVAIGPSAKNFRI